MMKKSLFIPDGSLGFYVALMSKYNFLCASVCIFSMRKVLFYILTVIFQKIYLFKIFFDRYFSNTFWPLIFKYFLTVIFKKVFVLDFSNTFWPEFFGVYFLLMLYAWNVHFSRSQYFLRNFSNLKLFKW